MHTDAARTVAPPPSADVRVVLGQLAAAAALRAAGVVALAAARTMPAPVVVAGRVLDGVSAVALPGGRYELGLALIARPTPLAALADHVRDQVAEAAGAAGMADRLGPVNVAFVGITEAVA